MPNCIHFAIVAALCMLSTALAQQNPTSGKTNCKVKYTVFTKRNYINYVCVGQIFPTSGIRANYTNAQGADVNCVCMETVNLLFLKLRQWNCKTTPKVTTTTTTTEKPFLNFYLALPTDG